MISHHHKTIFVHVPKCAGQSIEQAFLHHLGLSWENRAPLLLQRNRNPGVGPPRLAHLTVGEYLHYHYASTELFQRYYTFTVLRDPVSRVLSFYNYLRVRNRVGTRISLDRFVQEWLPRQMKTLSAPETSHEGKGWFIRPQADYLSADETGPKLDDVFRLEDLARGFDTLKERAGLASALPHVNKSRKHAGQGDLSAENLKVINELYAADFALLERHPVTPG